MSEGALLGLPIYDSGIIKARAEVLAGSWRRQQQQQPRGRPENQDRQTDSKEGDTQAAGALLQSGCVFCLHTQCLHGHLKSIFCCLLFVF